MKVAARDLERSPIDQVEPRPTAPELSAAEVVAYLRDLPRMWDDAPGSRRGVAESLFERVEVLGLRRMHLEPTPAAVAVGLVEAFSCASTGYGRGERTRPRGTYLIDHGSSGVRTPAHALELAPAGAAGSPTSAVIGPPARGSWVDVAAQAARTGRLRVSFDGNGQGVPNVTDWARVRISSTSCAGVPGPYSASMTTMTPSTSTIQRSSIWPGSWCQSVQDRSVS